MLTKGAIGNLVNRYRAVLRKCHLINVFGSLAVASMLVMGGAGAAEAGIVPITGPLSASEYGGGTVTPGTHTSPDPTGVVLKDASGNGVDVAGGPLIAQETNGQIFNVTYTGGSEADEASGKVAASVSISDSEFTGTSYFVGAGVVKGAGKANKFNPTVTMHGSSVELNNVKAESSNVIGGTRIHEGRNATVKVTNTDVRLTGNTVVEKVIGGIFTHGTRSQYIKKIETDSTNIYVGPDAVVTDKVVGGHFYNYHGTDASIKKTNVVIDGAKLGKDAVVIGGNNLELLGTANGTTPLQSTIETTETSITIKNGAEVGSVYGSDYAVGGGNNYNLASTADKVSIAIEDSKVNGDVIGGSYVDGKDATSDVTEAVSIVIKDSTVGGTITSDNLEYGEVKPNSIKKSTIDLTNVQAGEVAASKGTLYLRAYNGDTSGLQKITVSENVDVIVDVDGDSNDASGGDPTKAVSIGEGEYTATVTMAEGMYQGASSGTIENGVAKMKKSTSSVMSNVLDIASSQALTINRILMNDVRKRLGDIRSDEGTHGAWMRYDGGSFSGSHGYENDFTTFQLGVDTKPVEGAPRFGMAFAYTNSDADMKRGGAEMDAFSFAAYATKMYDNGLFVDVIGRVASADTEVVIDGNKKGSLDTLALSVSGELGWRANITDRFYLEPQAELTYTYVNSDSLTLNSGHAYDFDAVDSLIGRLGVAAGVKLPDNLGDVYVRASVVSEFLGEATVRGGNNVHSVDGDDTWFEYGIGANIKLTDKTYIWADVERTEGADIEEEWRGTVGLRYSF